MNRHIPSGSYGGVGGREFAAPSYPISKKELDFLSSGANLD